MCGIAGRINFDGRPVEPCDLQGLNAAMAHRGPDGEGIYCHGNVGLAHRRLAIIDPATGVQPFCNDDRSIALSFNGEIYNYLEIRRALEPSCHFYTQSDTEVLLRAYETWGIECVQRCRGMFAFALYDARTMTVYLVRDRLGIKPLYYYHTGDHCLFASELTALLQDRAVPREIDPYGVASFFRYQYVQTPATIYKQIAKLEPGHLLAIHVRQGTIKKRRYWQLNFCPVHKTEQAWLEELNAALDDIIRIYVRSDVPFGAFLSGGVDSSLVTALMARHLAEPVSTFSIGYSEPQYSELPFAAEASHIMQTKHHTQVVSSQLALDILPRLAVHFGEPFGDSSAVPTYYVSREAAQHVKMVLSGDGGDELFGGYEAYTMLCQEYGLAPTEPAAVSLARRARFWLQAYALHAGGKRVYGWAGWCWKRAHLRRPAFAGTIQQLCTPPNPVLSLQERYDLYRSVFAMEDARTLLRPEVTAMLDLHVPAVSLGTPGSLMDPLTFSTAQDVHTYLLDDILTKVDRASMANSLEVRVPLLDHTLVELAFTMPPQCKVRLNAITGHLETKYLLKQSATRFYTTAFLNRPKMGFGMPVAEWLRGPLKTLMEEELRTPHNTIFDWLQFDYVQEVVAGLFAGDDSRAPQTWCLLMFSLWMRYVHCAR
jgi:asparagine synthase (glutamine-hydrolysing)